MDDFLENFQRGGGGGIRQKPFFFLFRGVVYFRSKKIVEKIATFFPKKGAVASKAVCKFSKKSSIFEKTAFPKGSCLIPNRMFFYTLGGEGRSPRFLPLKLS